MSFVFGELLDVEDETTNAACSPGGETWRIERSALDPLLTDSIEREALRTMEDKKETSIRYRGNTLQICTCLVRSVRVNHVSLGTHCNMLRGGASSIAPSAGDGSCAAQRRPHCDSRLALWWRRRRVRSARYLVTLTRPRRYHVEIADVGDAMPQSALYAATALDSSEADSDAEVRHVREVSSDASSRAAKRQRRAPPSFTETRSGALHQLRLVSDALAPASAAAMKQRRLDTMRLGYDCNALRLVLLSL